MIKYKKNLEIYTVLITSLVQLVNPTTRKRIRVCSVDPETKPAQSPFPLK